ncbi:MAG: hypothetical protein M0P12_00840 [Paludibacteraceae bacterium]|nr:hypothetical protein [Paludibacteraceae bacterium]MCK9615936.1 hypothetical protein [Candidatus Omnitrophota bacterium]
MIPKTLFMAWSGSEVPEWAKKAFREYQDCLGSSWTYDFITDFKIPSAHVLAQEIERLPNLVYKADIYRLWLLETYGGVWVDTDTRSIRNLEPLLNKGAFATCHRTSAKDALENFHVDSCILGQEKNGYLTHAVIPQALASQNKTRYRFGIKDYLTEKCPVEITIGAFDEAATKPELFDFLHCRFNPIVPKREDSYIRHYLTNLHLNKI